MSDHPNHSPTDESPHERRRPSTGAEAVVQTLVSTGIDHIFGIQGGAIMPVYDALYNSEQITHITMAHEQGAAHAADAYGLVANEPGVCIATSGPGVTNLATGLADANMDSDPVLALTGQVPTDFVGNDAFQETDTVGISAPITKANYFADDADAVSDTVGQAWALARSGRQGPTLVDLPKDITQGETNTDPSDPTLPDTYTAPETADPDKVKSATEALATAEKPVILAGGGVIKSNAAPELREFATAYEIPVVTTLPGMGAFPEDHDLSLEWGGMHGTGYANMALTHCDVLFALGTRFDDRLTGAVTRFAPSAAVIHVDIDPAEIDKNIHADYPLVGDAGQVLAQVHDVMASAYNAAGTSPDRYSDWRDQCEQWRDQYSMMYETPDDEPLKPQYIVETVDEMTDDDTIVTTGVGQHQMWAAQYWTFTEPRTWVSSNGLGTMGYGLPAAIGARIAADEDRTVVCFDGDGSLLMTIQELSVAVRETLDIAVFVLNNAAVGMIQQWQDAFYDERRMASEYPWVPRFDELAEAFDAAGFRLSDYNDVTEIIDRALEDDGPAVVDVHIDPEENVYPMVPSGGDNSRFALTERQLSEL